MLMMLGSGVGMFVGWCVLDFILVHFAPSRGADFDWVLFLFPVASVVAGILVFRGRDIATRVGLAIAVAVFGSLLAMPLVLVFGVPFHFFIGGTL
ncbi:MAG: hypothetical protein ACTHN5_14185 [Phycisphaerae bacterium]